MLSWSQTAILLTVWFGVFFNYSVYSVIAPFFPVVVSAAPLARLTDSGSAGKEEGHLGWRWRPFARLRCLLVGADQRQLPLRQEPGKDGS